MRGTSVDQCCLRGQVLRWVGLLCCTLLVACGPVEQLGSALQPTSLPLPTLMPTGTAALPPTSTPTGPQDSGWLPAAPGVELRRISVLVADQLALITVVRLDPQQVRFAVGYRPEDPPTLSAWADETGALAVLNGGFFDTNNETVSLIIRSGQLVGESYVGRGGMFAVAADGRILLRALSDTPYDPNEALVEALQGWPLLVRPGGVRAYSYEDGQRARRSAIALDRSGHVLLIATATSSFTLAELSSWLSAADLDIEAAFNLDGGASTGLLLRSNRLSERVEAFVTLPIVLLVLPR